MHYAQKLFKGSSIVLASAALGAIVGYLLRLFLARSLEVHQFGLLYSILAFLGIFSLFKDIGLGSTLVKFLSEFSGKGEKEHIKPSILIVGTFQMIAALIIMIPIIVLSDSIAVVYFKDIAASLVIKLIAISFLIGTIMTTLQQSAQGLNHVKIYSLVEPIRIISTFIFSFLLIYLGIIGVAYAYTLAALIATVFLLVSLKYKGTITGQGKFKTDLTKKLLKFGIPVFIGGLSSLLLIYTDTIMLTIFSGVREVGLYQAALPTSQLLWVFVTSLVVVLLPTLSEMWAKKETTKISEGLTLLSKFGLLVIVPVASIMAAFAEDIIVILFGRAYIQAVFALQVLSLNAVFYTLFVIYSTSLIALDKPLANTKITAFISLVNFILNLFLIPVYGIVGAALTTSLSYLIGTSMCFHSIRKVIITNIDLKSLIKIVVIGLFTFSLMVSIKNVFQLNIWFDVLIAFLVGIVLYFGLILSTKTINKEEMRILKRLNIPVPRGLILIIGKMAGE